LILKNNNSTIVATGISVTTLGLNHAGAIINSGTGSTSSGSGVAIAAPIGSGITEIRQASATSSLTVSGAITVDSTPLTLRNTLGGAFTVTNSAATTGTGNLILKNDSSLAGGITISGAGGINHTGSLTNSGTGAGNVLISSIIGSNVTGVVQDSSTSTLRLTSSNTYSGDTTVQAGTLAIENINALQNSTLDTGSSGSQTVTFHSTNVIYNLGGLKGSDELNTGVNNTMRVGSNNQDTLFAGVLSGSGGRLNKVGNGSLRLTGANTYNGPTTISAGALLLNNPKLPGDSGTGTGNVTVSGGTLGGNGLVRPGTSGTIGVSAGAFIAPGDSAVAGGIGDLTLDGGGTTSPLLTMESSAEFNFQLGAGLSSDHISLWNFGTSTDFVRNSNVINISASIDATIGTYNLFSFYSDNGASLKAYGFSSGLTLNFLNPAISGVLSYDFGEINLTLNAIPEPSTLTLVAAWSLGLLALRRRTRARSVK